RPPGAEPPHAIATAPHRPRPRPGRGTATANRWATSWGRWSEERTGGPSGGSGFSRLDPGPERKDRRGVNRGNLSARDGKVLRGTTAARSGRPTVRAEPERSVGLRRGGPRREVREIPNARETRTLRATFPSNPLQRRHRDRCRTATRRGVVNGWRE